MKALGFRDIGLYILPAILLTMTSPSAPAANLRDAMLIDSSGKRIPSIYWGLSPNPKFAHQLLNPVRETGPQEVHLQLLSFKSGESSTRECVLRATGSKGAALRTVAAQGYNSQCFGQYMEPEYEECGAGCGGNTWLEFFSTGYFPHQGFSMPGTSACDGCELLESACTNPY